MIVEQRSENILADIDSQNEIEKDEYNSDGTIPDFITLLLVLDINYPEDPPKILAKTNVSILLNISFVNLH